MNNRRMMLAYAARDNRYDDDRQRVERMTVNNYYGESYAEPIEGKFRDSRGRQHYDNGRYAPMSREYHIVTDGYNFPLREEMQEWRRQGEERMREPQMSYYPRRYEEDYKPVIGFAAGDDTSMRYMPPQPMNEMVHRNGSMERGYGSYDGMQKLTKPMAEEWMRNIHNGDGSTGQHWTLEQTTQVMQQKNYPCDPVEFWVAMNMMYSDYYTTAKKFNVNNADFYAAMAKAFLCDEDAESGKLARYYSAIVK